LEQYDEAQVTSLAWSFLRSNTTGTLRFGENMQDINYVIAHDGFLIMPAMVAMLQPCNTIMYVPDYSNDCMEMHVSLQQFQEDESTGAYADRWRVYHGEPRDVQWAKVAIDAARFRDMFVDGEGMQESNPLSEVESKLCKQINKEFSDSLKACCLAKTNVTIDAPLVVGIDSLGIDVRAQFGIVRIPAEQLFQTSDDVLKLLKTY